MIDWPGQMACTDGAEVAAFIEAMQEALRIFNAWARGQRVLRRRG